MSEQRLRVAFALYVVICAGLGYLIDGLSGVGTFAGFAVAGYLVGRAGR